MNLHDIQPASLHFWVGPDRPCPVPGPDYHEANDVGGHHECAARALINDPHAQAWYCDCHCQPYRRTAVAHYFMDVDGDTTCQPCRDGNHPRRPA